MSDLREEDTSPCFGAECGRPPRKERRDAAEHRQRILHAARELFGRHGVDATPMHEIARAAGVGQGTLYRRYAHKGELCVALLEQNTHQFFERIEAFEGCPSGAKGALVQLEFLLTSLASFNQENAPLLGAIGDAACGDRRRSAYHSPLYRRLRATALQLLHQAVEQGETEPLDVDGTVDALLAPLSIDLFLYQRDELGYTPERTVAALRHLLFHGLRARR